MKRLWRMRHVQIITPLFDTTHIARFSHSTDEPQPLRESCSLFAARAAFAHGLRPTHVAVCNCAADWRNPRIATGDAGQRDFFPPVPEAPSSPGGFPFTNHLVTTVEGRTLFAFSNSATSGRSSGWNSLSFASSSASPRRRGASAVPALVSSKAW
jgi:hypothetical protein